jgi:hypothetical protein
MVCFAGCDSSGVKLAPVTGTVTYKGAPLKTANIKFMPESGPMAVGMTDENGKFKLSTNGRPGATVGLHKVAITKMSGGAVETAAPSNPKPEDMMKMQKENMGKKNTGPKSEIPERYANPDSSKLTADVSAKGADNDFSFDLQ